MPTKIGSFDLIQAIGEGPGGPVHLAVDTVLDRMVALKQVNVLDGSTDEPGLADMTEQVAQLSRIRSHCIGHVYSCSKPHESTVYLAREYIAGIDLATLLQGAPVLDRMLAIAILWGTTTGLVGFHQEDQLHGNLKFTNVFLRQSGGIKLVDPLVMALATTAAGGQIDYTTDWFGAPNLLAPEQRDGAPPSLATDTYSIGAIAYRLITGHLYDDPSAPNKSSNPGQTDPTCPDNIGNQIAKCLDSNPNERIGAANNLRNELTEWLQDSGLTPKQALDEAIQSVSSLFLMANLSTSAPSTTVGDGHHRLINQQASTPVERAVSDGVEGYDLEMDTPSDTPQNAPNALDELVESWSTLRDESPPMKDGDGEEAKRQHTVPSAAPQRALPPMGDVIRAQAEALWESAFVRILVGIVAIATVVFFLLPDRDESPAPTDTDTVNNGLPQPPVVPTTTPLPTDPTLAAIAKAKNTAYEQPRNGEARLVLSQAYFNAEKYLAALEEVTTAEKLLPHSPRPPRLAIRILLKQQEGTKAIVKARAALKLHSTDAMLHLLIARALLTQGRPQDAALSLETAVQMDASLAEAWIELGNLHLAATHYEKARIAYERAIEERPDNTAATIGLGRAMLRLGRSGRAVDVLTQGLKLADDDPQLEYTVGRVLLFGNRYVEAETHLKRYREARPDDWRGLFSLGLLRLRQGHAQEALDLLDDLQPPQSLRAEIWYNRGLAQMHQGNLQDAIQSLSSAVRQRETCWEAICERAKAYHRLGRLAKAREGYEQTLRLQPTSVLARSMLETRLDSALARMQLGLPCGRRVGLDILDE
jgi:tetratricopeptide (TPR) repeat protein/serine/threonine protein kinase